MNVIARLEFKQVYHDATVQRVSQYTTVISQLYIKKEIGTDK